MTGMIEIRAPGMQPERRQLPTAAVILGRKPAGGIALPSARELADEHLVISPNLAGCHIALLPGVDLEPTLRGRRFRQSDIVWGDEVILGRTSLRFIGEKPSQGPSKIVLGGMAFLAMAGAWLVMGGDPESIISSKRPDAPALFAATATCPATGVAAMPQAQQAEHEANARAQRYNFDALDGVKAVRLYALAARCYQTAGDAASAERAQKALVSWRTHVDSNYRNHDLQLRLALDREDLSRARSELEQLQPFVRDLSGPYLEWIARIAKQLQ